MASVDGAGLLGDLANGNLPDYSDPSVALEMFAKHNIQLNNGLNLGPYVLGFSFDLVLFGISVHQFITYLSSPGKDRMFVRVIVYWTMMVSAAQSIYGLYFVWFLFVQNFGTYRHFYEFDKMAWYGPLAALITAPIQVFYMERAYRVLRNNKWVIITIAPLIFGSVLAVGGLTYFMRHIQITEYTSFVGPWFYSWDATILAADILLTGMILTGLVQAKTGWPSTDRVVRRLIRISVETQLPATVYAIGFLATYLVVSHSGKGTTLVYFWIMQLSKVYVVSLLAVLNFRTTLREATEYSSEEPQTFQLSGDAPYRGGRSRREEYPLDKITVDTTTYRETTTIPMPKVGLNRQDQTDPEHSPNGTMFQRMGDEWDSQADLVEKRGD